MLNGHQHLYLVAYGGRDKSGDAQVVVVRVRRGSITVSPQEVSRKRFQYKKPTKIRFRYLPFCLHFSFATPAEERT